MPETVVRDTHFPSLINDASIQWAYRYTSRGVDDTELIYKNNDDDGEDGAGKRLAHLLEMRKEDGVLVVVSRWYGGIPLGPKRFAHITNVARNLLVSLQMKE
jgi:putative IMPACT (imprinted ancient) family translation regulator